MGRLRAAVLFVLLGLASLVGAQPQVVHWTAKLVPSDVRAGETAQIVMTAKIDEPYHIYSLTTPPEGIPTSFEVKQNEVLSVGKTQEPAPHMKPDAVDVIRGMFEKEVAFGIPVKVLEGVSGAQKITVVATAQACDAKICLPAIPVSVPLEFTVAPGAPREDRLAPVNSIPEQPAGYVAPPLPTDGKGTGGAAVDDTQIKIAEAREGGLASYLLLAFLAGLAALITPCVFPMIPVTVSFFSKKTTEGDRKVNYRDALAYCFGIIGTFTLLGLIVTLAFGSTGVQDLATNPWVNLAMFALFVFLAFNLFGVVELRLPSKLVNTAYQGSRKGGLAGPLLMGLTFSLTTFTCTVPFVGTLLAAAAQGDILYPTLGMAAFSSAFALPFFLLALFPQFLAKMPKSGGWLATVKAFMGFLELVAAVKFLSSAELAFNLGWITRSVFLALWAVILFVAGLYTIGWLRLGHEDEGAPKIGWFRRLSGVATVAAAIWCLAGIQGRSLGLFDSFAPPDPYPGTSNPMAHGSIPWLENYDEALAKAKTEGKPVFINFTGVNCSNCRWMERNMFTKASVIEEFSKFVMVELYTDRPMDKERQALQKKLVGVALNPTYVLVSQDGKVLKVHQGLEQDEAKFIEFLRSAPGKVASK